MFADVAIPENMTVAGAVVLGLAGGIPGAAKILTGYLKARDAAKDEHIAMLQNARLADAKRYQKSMRAMIRRMDAREAQHEHENRITIETLLTLQKETVLVISEIKNQMTVSGQATADAIHGLSSRVEALEEKVVPKP